MVSIPTIRSSRASGTTVTPVSRRSARASLHLLEPANRSYHLDADKERVIENNTDYAVIDLETANHGNGEVIDLSDEQNREAYGKAA